MVLQSNTSSRAHQLTKDSTTSEGTEVCSSGCNQSLFSPALSAGAHALQVWPLVCEALADIELALQSTLVVLCVCPSLHNRDAGSKLM